MNVAFTGEIQPGPHMSLWGHYATRIPETDQPQLYTTILIMILSTIFIKAFSRLIFLFFFILPWAYNMEQ